MRSLVAIAEVSALGRARSRVPVGLRVEGDGVDGTRKLGGEVWVGGN